MKRQLSPFAALSGAEKQIRWLEYQSVHLPYIDVKTETTEDLFSVSEERKQEAVPAPEHTAKPQHERERPAPPPEVPRIMPTDFNRTKHTQYNAVIARLKQAELQSRCSTSHASQ